LTTCPPNPFTSPVAPAMPGPVTMTLLVGKPRRLADAVAGARGTNTMASAMTVAAAADRRRLIIRPNAERSPESGRA
jgi:hypothetical protein